MRKHLSCISNYFPVLDVARRNWPEAASVSVHRQHIYDYPIVAVIFATIISQTHILHPKTLYDYKIIIVSHHTQKGK